MRNRFLWLLLASYCSSAPALVLHSLQSLGAYLPRHRFSMGHSPSGVSLSRCGSSTDHRSSGVSLPWQGWLSLKGTSSSTERFLPREHLQPGIQPHSQPFHVCPPLPPFTPDTSLHISPHISFCTSSCNSSCVSSHLCFCVSLYLPSPMFFGASCLMSPFHGLFCDSLCLLFCILTCALLCLLTHLLPCASCP